MDGILIIDKPADWTSHDVVARVRHILRVKKVGHTGTLDPFATGVLVILVGQATRLAQFLSGAVKEYEALVRFGFATDTGDMTGKALNDARPQVDGGKNVCRWSALTIKLALSKLRGGIEQVPPMYSAKKIEGHKLYELARRGLEVERAAVRVYIHKLEAMRQEGSLLRHNEDGTCDLSLRVVCSAGTYIRTLAEDLGKLLGAPAHLASLRRTRAGDFRIEDAISLDELNEKAEAGAAYLDKLFLPMDAALSGYPFVHLTADEALKTLHGVALPFEDGKVRPKHIPVRMLDENGRLIAVGFYEAESRSLRPRVVFSPEK